MVNSGSIGRNVAATLLRGAIGVVALSSAVLRAQDDSAPTLDAMTIQERPGYVAAVQAIAAGKEEEGIAALTELLATAPDEPDLFLLHYNLACGHARRRALDPAFAELATSIEGGYAIHPLRLQNLLTDPDLEPLRADSRFTALRARAIALHESLRASFDELTSPYEFIPSEAEPVAAADGTVPAPKLRPLLVVLHPFGTERAEFAQRLFEPFCVEHGFALFAPGGPQMIAPERFAFFASSIDFVDGFRMAHRRFIEKLVAFRTRARVDPQRIYVTGSGQGAGLGFALAIRNPQWVRGAVLFDGGYAPATTKDWIGASADYGRRFAVIHREDDPRYPFAPLENYVLQLESQGIDIRVFPRASAATLTPEMVTATLVERLAWIDEVPFQRTPSAGR